MDAQEKQGDMHELQSPPYEDILSKFFDTKAGSDEAFTKLLDNTFNKRKRSWGCKAPLSLKFV